MSTAAVTHALVFGLRWVIRRWRVDYGMSMRYRCRANGLACLVISRRTRVLARLSLSLLTEALSSRPRTSFRRDSSGRWT